MRHKLLPAAFLAFTEGSEIDLISNVFSLLSSDLIYSSLLLFLSFFHGDYYRWLLNREVRQKRKIQCKSAAGSARRGSGMLLVFDIPPSLFVQPLPLSISRSLHTHTHTHRHRHTHRHTHTLYTMICLHPHLYFFRLMLNFHMVVTLCWKVPHHKQLITACEARCKARVVFHMTGWHCRRCCLPWWHVEGLRFTHTAIRNCRLQRFI